MKFRSREIGCYNDRIILYLTALSVAQISERLQKSELVSRGFEISWNLVVRCPSAQWRETQYPVTIQTIHQNFRNHEQSRLAIAIVFCRRIILKFCWPVAFICLPHRLTWHAWKHYNTNRDCGKMPGAWREVYTTFSWYPEVMKRVILTTSSQTTIRIWLSLKYDFLIW